MEKEIREILGRNIKRIRQYRGIGGEQLAKKVELRPETISRIETGKEENLGLKYLLKICKELGVTPEELFQKDGNLLTLRFVISEHNINTLKELIFIIKGLIEENIKK